MADLNLKLGQTIQCHDGRTGIVRYIGSLHIAAGDWLGLELSDNTGKNDGSVKGERYFDCQPGHGIFVRKESAVKIVKQAAASARPNGTTPTSNGAAVRPRPSSGVPADVARKRQSLMSAGSGSTAGSRLSVRSPTKSPTKAPSSVSSATSTPRTGTPATTARTSDSSTKSRLSTTGRQSMGPPSAPSKSSGHATRPSVGSGARSTTPNATSATRQSLTGSRLSVGPRPLAKHSVPSARTLREEPQPKSPPIAEEDQVEDVPGIDARMEDTDQEQAVVEPTPPPPPPDPPEGEMSRPRTTSVSRSVASVETRTADKKEVEQLKAKIRTLEKKALENRDRLKASETVKQERDRFETIIQTLQKKIKTNQQEISDLRAKYEDAEKRIGQPSEGNAEHESEIELATLDKEMAEERAEMYQSELEVLKVKHEELELEAEILREENRELGSVMSPEEKASAGWMQMEREQERLRQALILLRDMSQENEGSLKSQIKELEETLDETAKTASKYDEVAERLAKTEGTNKHLMEQLEVAETNDEVVFAMETQREQSQALIEQLRKQVQDFEEHIQVTDELELFHVEEEKRLHYQLDETEALLSEQHRHAGDQDKVIEDLEYSLTKFRDVVQGLQSDIDELRRSKDISQLEAHEMSSKSRAMMDLNLQLQNSASKTQMKTIDYEMGRMQADQAKSHLDIIQLFVPDSFEADRNPVLSLLCFKRVKSKALLTRSILAERMRDRPHLVQDNPFAVYETMEKMSWIANACDRFVRFVSTCSTQEFSRLSNASYELEPVERSMTGWVEALKRDELSSDSPDHLQRMVGILLDMSEKLIPDCGEAKATELVAQSGMVEAYMESTTLQLNSLTRAVQDRLGPPTDEDEESQAFDKKMDQASNRSRTIKYLGGKVTQLLNDLRSGSMCLGETAWPFFEEAERLARQTSEVIRAVGEAVLVESSRVDYEEPLSYSSIIKFMTSTAGKLQKEQDGDVGVVDDVFTFLGGRLQLLQKIVDDLQTKASDISSATEFEPGPAPWTSRAKEIKAQKLVSLDAQEEVTRVKARLQEQVAQLSEKDKEIEEQQIRIDLLENRSKEAKAKDTDVKNLKDEVERLTAEKSQIAQTLEKTKAEHVEMLTKREAEVSELESLRTATATADGSATTTKMGDQPEIARLLQAQVDLLNTEVLRLQSAVRYLKAENHSLRVPANEIALLATRNAWLDSANLKTSRRRDGRSERLKKESADVLEGLIDLATMLKPVRLSQKTAEDSRPWMSVNSITRWQTAKQREELEQWSSWRSDVVKRGKVETRSRIGRGDQVGRRHPLPVVEMKEQGSDGVVPGPVEIVAASP